MMEKTKITLKIYEPLLKSFEVQIDRLCLKRDAFLNHMLRTEVRHLQADMSGIRQSDAARRYIAGKLKRLGTHPVNVVVDKEVAHLLNEVVESSNMVRDAFANRLLLFLRGSRKMLNYFELPLSASQSNFDSGIDVISTGPLAAMEEIFADPMYYLRIAAEERFKQGFYMMELPGHLDGFACYLPDKHVPGTHAHKEQEELSIKLLKELEEIEGLAFDVPLLEPSNGEGK